MLAVGLWNGKRRAALVAIVALALIGPPGSPSAFRPPPRRSTSAPLSSSCSTSARSRAGQRGWRSRRAAPARSGSPPGQASTPSTWSPPSAPARARSSTARRISGPSPAGRTDPGRHGLASGPRDQRHHRGWSWSPAGWLLRGLLRPAAAEDGHEPAEGIRARRSRKSTAPTRSPRSPSGRTRPSIFAAGGFVAYRVLRETAVVSGDPVGPPGSAPAILESFVRFAEARGWNVVITAASDRHLSACKQLGLRVLRIGDEAVVDPRTFSLEGRPIRKVRQSIARVKRHGWRVEVVDDGVVSAELGRELAEVEADWRSRQRRLIGFAMTLGRLAGTDDRDGGVYVLGARRGRPAALLPPLRLVPRRPLPRLDAAGAVTSRTGSPRP